MRDDAFCAETRCLYTCARFTLMYEAHAYMHERQARVGKHHEAILKSASQAIRHARSAVIQDTLPRVAIMAIFVTPAEALRGGNDESAAF